MGFACRARSLPVRFQEFFLNVISKSMRMKVFIEDIEHTRLRKRVGRSLCNL